MRKDPFSVGSYVHVYNRGHRKMPIVRDNSDKWRFLKMLYYFNSERLPENWDRELRRKHVILFSWPKDWPKRQPLVKILAYCLMKNHYHLLLKEIKDGGITKFMRKLGTGMSNYYNTKYKETGTIFQGSYKARRVDEDMYLRDLSVYIQVKNPFELYAGGLKNASANFDRAYKFAQDYQFCSLADYTGERNSPIIDKDLLGEIFQTPRDYKDFSYASIKARNLDSFLSDLALDVGLDSYSGRSLTSTT